MTIGKMITAGILAGKTDQEILDEVHAKFTNAGTKVASVRWYRSQLKKQPAAEMVRGPSTATVDARSTQDPMIGAAERWRAFKKAAGVKVDDEPESELDDGPLRRQLKKLLKKVAYVTDEGKLFVVSVDPTPANIKKYMAEGKVLNALDEEEAVAQLRALHVKPSNTAGQK